MKKTVLLLLCFGFFLCDIAMSEESFYDCGKLNNSHKLEALREARSKYLEKLKQLIVKYEMSVGEERDTIKEKIKKLVESGLKKNTDFKQAIIEKNRRIIEILEKDLAQLKVNKQKYTDTKVKFLTSTKNNIAKINNKFSFHSKSERL